MKRTITDEEPVLDPELERQLRKEINESNMAGDSLAMSGVTTQKVNLGAGAMVVMGASIIGLVGLQFPFLFIKNAPFMATPAGKVQNALKFIIEHNKNKRAMISSPRSATNLSQSSPRPQQEAHIRASASATPPVFVDLGSGDGQAVYEAAKLGYKAVGIEFNWTLWALSSFRRQFFWSSEVKRRSTFLLQDFAKYDLKDANTIMIFAVPRTMPILGKKIQSECSPGTTIMAYRFEMPLAATASKDNEDDEETTKESIGRDAKDHEAIGDLRLQAKCIYDQEEMRIYSMGER